MENKQTKLTDQMRQIIEDCGQTRYAIAKATGISQATLARLVSGDRFLSAESMDALGEYLGLEIRVVTKKKKSE